MKGTWIEQQKRSNNHQLKHNWKWNDGRCNLVKLLTEITRNNGKHLKLPPSYTL